MSGCMLHRFKDKHDEKQPDGGSNERCTFLRLYSVYSSQNWNDVACSYNKIYNYICEKKSAIYMNGM